MAASERELWRRMGGAGSLISADQLFGVSSAHIEDNIFIVAHDMSADVALHRHGFFELCFAFRGGVINRIGGEDRYMVENSLCIMNATSEHELIAADRRALVVNVCLRRELFAEGVFRRFWEDDTVVSRFLRGEAPCDHLFLTDLTGEAFGHTMRALIREYRRAGQREDYTVDGRTLMLLARTTEVESYSYLGLNERMMQVLDLINTAPERATCASIARELGLSEVYLSQYVKRRMGTGLAQLIRNARLERAMKLLRTTDLAVDAVAHRVGYASYSHFNHIFTERYGVTPSQSRAFARGTV